MPKTVSEAYAELEKLEGGSEYIEAVKAEIREANTEAKNKRTLAKDTDAQLKKVQTENKAFKEKLGLSDDAGEDDIEEAFEKLSTVDKGDGKGISEHPEFKKLLRTVDKLTKDQERKDQELEQERQKSREATINGKKKDVQNQILGKVSEKLISPSLSVKDMMSYANVDEDGNLTFKMGAEEFDDIDDFTNKWIDSNKELVKNQQTPGGGTGSGGGKGGPNNTPNFENLSPAQKIAQGFSNPKKE